MVKSILRSERNKKKEKEFQSRIHILQVQNGIQMIIP